MTTELAVKKGILDEVVDLAVTTPKDVTDAHLKGLLDLDRALLPIEAQAKADLQSHIADARREVSHQLIDLPRIGFEPLSWRHANGLPKIVPMSLHHPSITIAGRENDGWVSTGNHSLPFPVVRCFSDVIDLAKSHCWRSGSRMEYTFEFTGLIPDHARVSIAEALQNPLFGDVYLLVESPAEAWKTHRVKGLTNREKIREAMANIAIDPLVVGYAHESFWFVDKFDTTSLEEYVVSEFAHKALEAGS